MSGDLRVERDRKRPVDDARSTPAPVARDALPARAPHQRLHHARFRARLRAQRLNCASVLSATKSGGTVPRPRSSRARSVSWPSSARTHRGARGTPQRRRWIRSGAWWRGSRASTGTRPSAGSRHTERGSYRSRSAPNGLGGDLAADRRDPRHGLEVRPVASGETARIDGLHFRPGMC